MPAGTLRERKKRETHRALADAARELVHERGLEHVTVDDIAAAAGVSVRTFFNYFAGKDEAIVAVDRDILEELADDLRARPKREGPVAALRAVLLPEPESAERLRGWQLRNELVARYPALQARHLAAMVEVEEALAAAVADRLGVDPASDPTPRAIVAAALAALRAGFAWWERSDRSLPLTKALDRALAPIHR